jgi:hypothetical protein
VIGFGSRGDPTERPRRKTRAQNTASTTDETCQPTLWRVICLVATRLPAPGRSAAIDHRFLSSFRRHAGTEPTGDRSRQSRNVESTAVEGSRQQSVVPPGGAPQAKLPASPAEDLSRPAPPLFQVDDWPPCGLRLSWRVSAQGGSLVEPRQGTQGDHLPQQDGGNGLGRQPEPEGIRVQLRMAQRGRPPGPAFSPSSNDPTTGRAGSAATCSTGWRTSSAKASPLPTSTLSPILPYGLPSASSSSSTPST